MKVIILLTLAALASVAGADEDEPTPITMDAGVSLAHCHTGDAAWIHMTPIPENDRRREGWLRTTNTLLTLRECSMFPDGLCRLEVRTICRGLTGAVSTIVVDVQRPPPAPRLARARKPAPAPVPLRLAAAPAPPLPPGLVPDLPGAPTNRASYHDFQLMHKYYSKLGRRSQ